MEHPKLNLTIPWEEIELGAQQQIIKTLNMPELKQLAIMPDVHQGYDLPIGGVALLEGVVSPSFVGYDIGCVDKDTEVFVKGHGWVTLEKLPEITDPIVFQFDPVYSRLSYTPIIEYIKNPSKGFYHINNNNGYDVLVSKSHRNLFKDDDTDELVTFTTEELLEMDDPAFLRDILPRGLAGYDPYLLWGEAIFRLYVAFKILNQDFDFTLEEFSVQVTDMSQAERLERLLIAADCGYVKTISVPAFSGGQIVIEFRWVVSPFEDGFREAIKDLSPRCISVIHDELSFWEEEHYEYDSGFEWKEFNCAGSDTEFVDLIQLAYFVTGDANLGIYRNMRNTSFKVYEQDGIELPIEDHGPIPSEDGFEYCIKVPTGYFLARRNNKIFITGNCGMGHVNTGMTAKELKLDTEKKKIKFFESLQNKVPAGVGKVRGTKDLKQFISASNDKKFDEQINKLVYEQYGTLGSGNHFLELGVNSKGEVGITVHSGSRRPGYDVASYYLRYGLLPIDSDEGLAYLADMQWMLDFALANRSQMLKDVLELLGLGYLSKKFLAQMINENHNHATRLIDGTVLHRKGATPADKDQLGIIPANQRDGVWITRGLGREEFLYSASHGAGRKMSRKQASQKGTTKELEKLMKGVVCRTDKGVLDEAPWAYKPIDVVLKAQDGILVDVIDHFKPIIVLKG